jgi:hypothetical protein
VKVGGYSSTCQNYYASLPTGWIIAPDNSDSYTVITAYTWSTTVMLTSGNGYCTAECGGYNYGSSYLRTDGSYYLSNICNGQILII